MLESYLKLPNSERWSFARAELVFCEHKSFLRNHWPRAMSPAASEKNPTTAAPAAAPCSGTLQRHPAAAPCNGTNMPTPKRTRAPLSLQHPKAAPRTSSRVHRPLLYQHPAAAACSSTLHLHPCSTLKHHPCATTSRLARQHPQAAALFKVHTHHCDSSTLQHHPQAASAAPLCNGTSMPTPNCTHHCDSKQHPAPAPCSCTPSAPACPLQIAHTILTAARTAATAYPLQSAQNTLTAALFQQVEICSA